MVKIVLFLKTEAIGGAVNGAYKPAV